ncbi:DUF2837 family protein [Escherichia coli]|nr:DUF2837 family protein [Escherichia coli]
MPFPIMKQLIYYTLIIIPIIYGLIHFLEYSSFLSRVAGIVTGSKVISYTLQQSTFVLTRFGFVAMMPMIGLIVDYQVTKYQYLFMVHASLLVATLLCLLSYFCRKYIISYFINVIDLYSNNGSLIKSILIGFIKREKTYCEVYSMYKYIRGEKEARKLILISSVVFGTYAIGVYLSFFAALNFYEHRSSIGQLSGLINAFATVLLTFYIEPKISISIDRNDFDAEKKVLCLLIGRLLGVGLLAQVIVALMWFI